MKRQVLYRIEYDDADPANLHAGKSPEVMSIPQSGPWGPYAKLKRLFEGPGGNLSVKVEWKEDPAE